MPTWLLSLHFGVVIGSIIHRLISTCSSKIFLDPNGVKRMGPSARLPNLYYILLRLMILIRNHYRRDRDIEIVMI